MRKECEGCSVLKPNGDCNLVNEVIESNEGIVKDCPCKECLVKIMCDTACPEYKDFWERVLNRRREGRNYGLSCENEA